MIQGNGCRRLRRRLMYSIDSHEQGSAGVLPLLSAMERASRSSHSQNSY
jgi:hypothetical protein